MSVDRKVIGLVVVGLALVGAAIVVPVGDVRYHSTTSSSDYPNVSEAQRFNYAVYHYENLSDRAQELYRETLRNGGEYTVPIGEGAPEFRYPDRERLRASDYDGDITEALSAANVAVVRPNDSSLPPADEPDGNDRIESITTQTKTPRLGSGAYVPKLLALVAGFAALCLAGFRYVRRP